MSNYGFNFNASAVSNKDGKVSVGVNFKDSDGFEFDTTEEGSVKEVTDALYKKFVKEYIAETARLQKAAEEKAKAEKEKEEKKSAAEGTPDMIARLRRLEKENAKLREEIDKADKANTKIAQERAAKASAKYKDPNYNKPGDDKSKVKIGVLKDSPKEHVSAKPSTCRKAQKFVSNDYEDLLRELFSDKSELFDIVDLWNRMGWPW